ncbi:hypothetical protein Agub_g3611, partial [Astrephomene gubernaculifera]
EAQAEADAEVDVEGKAGGGEGCRRVGDRASVSSYPGPVGRAGTAVPAVVDTELTSAHCRGGYVTTAAAGPAEEAAVVVVDPCGGAGDGAGSSNAGDGSGTAFLSASGVAAAAAAAAAGSHSSTSASSCSSSSSVGSSPALVLSGLLVHSAADGLAMGAASLQGGSGGSSSGSTLTLTLAAAVMAHKLPVALGLSSYLRGAGWGSGR